MNKTRNTKNYIGNLIVNSHLDTIHTLDQLSYILNSQLPDYICYLKWKLPKAKHVTCKFEGNFIYTFSLIKLRLISWKPNVNALDNS